MRLTPHAPTHPTERLTLIPRDGHVTIAVRHRLDIVDADHLAALCLSLPPETQALTIDCTGAGLLGASVLHRIARVASSWRYARSAPAMLRFRASRDALGGAPLADEVPVEVRYPARVKAVRRRSAIPHVATRGVGPVVAPPRLALRASA